MDVLILSTNKGKYFGRPYVVYNHSVKKIDILTTKHAVPCTYIITYLYILYNKSIKEKLKKSDG